MRFTIIGCFIVLLNISSIVLAYDDFDGLKNFDNEILQVIKSNSAIQKENSYKKAKSTYNLLIASLASRDFKNAVNLRERILSSLETIPLNKKIEKFDELRVVTLTMDTIFELKKLTIKTDPSNFKSKRVDAGDKRALSDMYDLLWDSLLSYAENKKEKIEFTKLSNVDRSERIIDQLVGPSKGKVAILELIANTRTKTYRWNNLNYVKIDPPIISSSGPLQFNISLEKKNIILLIDGNKLYQNILDNENWFLASSIKASIIIKDNNWNDYISISKLFFGKNNIYVFHSKNPTFKIKAIDPHSSSKICEWNLSKFIDDSESYLKNVMNQIIDSASYGK